MSCSHEALLDQNGLPVWMFCPTTWFLSSGIAREAGIEPPSTAAIEMEFCFCKHCHCVFCRPKPRL